MSVILLETSRSKVALVETGALLIVELIIIALVFLFTGLVLTSHPLVFTALLIFMSILVAFLYISALSI